MQKLEEVIELYELQQYYEEKSKSPDYIAIMAGVAKGVVIGETANAMTRRYVARSKHDYGG